MSNETVDHREAKIKILGIGGGGCNLLAQVHENLEINGSEFIAVNTDRHSLDQNPAGRKILLGRNMETGAGGNPARGREAALSSGSVIRDAVAGADGVFIITCLGGGTGSGAAPVIAGICKDMGIPVAAMATTPFNFENRRAYVTAEAERQLNAATNFLGIISNQELIDNAAQGAGFQDSIARAAEPVRLVLEHFSVIINALDRDNESATIRKSLSSVLAAWQP